MNVNVNVNQMARQTKPVSCLEILKTLTARQVKHYWNQYLSLCSTSTFFLERGKKGRKYQTFAITFTVHPVPSCWGFQFCCLIDVIRSERWQLNHSQCLELAVSHRHRPSVDYWCEYSIPSCCLVYHGIDPILISGWPGSPLTELS